MAKTPIFLVLMVCCLLAVFAERKRFTLYVNSHHRDLNETLYADDHECHTIPYFYRNRASSIKTHGHCVVLFPSLDCKEGEEFFFKAHCEGDGCCRHTDFADCEIEKDDGTVLKIDNAAQAYVIC
uniref:Nodule Cysteine-Rich (NCR) secreted peptide n=1 Tax=Panagrellus redivivus TaxID=6233 RepID=A0A7E4USB1_PANRE